MNRVFSILGVLTLFLSLNGFQCASSMMNSAEMAIDKGDYAKAKSAAEEELTLRPDNARAWLILGRSERKLGNLMAMKSAFDKAISHRDSETGSLKPQELEAIRIETFAAWSSLYDRAQVLRESGEHQRSVRTLDTALVLLPGSPMTYAQIGVSKGTAGDEEGSVAAFAEYVSLTKEDIQKGLGEGLRLGFDRARVNAMFGSPDFPYNPNVNNFGDVYQAKNLVVYYITEKREGRDVLEVRGWDYLSSGARPFIISSLSADPYYSRAFDLRAAKEYDDAIALLKMVDGLDPDRQDDIGNLLGQLYIDAGRVEEAEAELDRRIAENPEIVAYRIRYSVLKHKQQDYAAAVTTLEQALKLDYEEGGKEHRDILYNLGAFHKNWGISLQNRVSTPTADQQKAYTEKFETALSYYTELDKVQKSFDFDLLHEIGMMMVVTGKDEGLPGIIARYEAEKDNPTYASQSYYWRNLSKLYIQMSDKGEEYLEKARAASAKAKELGG